ncbi:hypothetical protein [Aureimonas sp. ME7]|uniref:plasmid mobilization protein n=1 Tax=Aureimonas sp. ME7 TaxID=2744252 RepID=UPI0015F55383|nr:hypothetical protein [Aureimonas sp. ME7]
MKTSDATIRFRSRPDDRRLYEQAAGRADLRLSAWVRRACRNAATGQTVDIDTRRDLVRLRMSLNRLATLSTALPPDGEAAVTIREMRAVLDRRIGRAGP